MAYSSILKYQKAEGGLNYYDLHYILISQSYFENPNILLMYLFMGLGFELSASYLQSRHSTA
jgi:hypothetical protein